MANFAANLYIHKPSFSLLDNDLNMELLSHCTCLNPIPHQDPTQNFHTIMGFSVDNFSNCQMPEIPGNSWDNFAPQTCDLTDQVMSVIDGSRFHGSSKKRKTEDLTDSCSRNSSPPISDSPKIVSEKGKRGRNKEKKTEEKKPQEVVHVRAKQLAVTALAERVRRGKINEKFRCLQDMVPGCYKEMGMAVMLDEIINYVHSLQNQVEFLSMKLAVASAVHDSNTQTYFIDSIQKKAQAAQDVDGLLSTQEGYKDQLEAPLACFQSTWPSN